MVNRPEILAVVQARGGSKGLPGKNVRLLGGHPLIAYSIASGLAAKTVDRVIVSTDCPEIAEIARSYGAEVPFIRPAALAEDDTPDFPVFAHAITWLQEQEGYSPKVVVQLRPTTPFRPKGMIDASVEKLLADSQADCVRGVTVPKQTPYKMWRDGKSGYLIPLLETQFAEPYNMPRQNLPPAYFQTGHIDAIRTTTITEKQSLTGSKVLPHFIDPLFCVDIDTPSDFKNAEALLGTLDQEIDVPQSSGAQGRRDWPKALDLVIFDFDGVFTDNRVLVFDDSREAVVCNRGDGMGIAMLRDRGVPMLVLSTEQNPVIRSRCDKLRLEAIHSLPDKRATLVELAQKRKIDLAHAIYVGNDVNDLGCMGAVALSIAVADAHPDVLCVADHILANRGGFGAVREVCDIILNKLERKELHAPSC